MSTKDDIVTSIGAWIELADELNTTGHGVLQQFDEGITAAQGAGADGMVGELSAAKEAFEAVLEAVANLRSSAEEVSTATAGAGTGT